MNIPLMKIRETIRLLISQPKISSRKAAKAIGISRPSITKIKNIYDGVTVSSVDVINLSDGDLLEKLGLNKKARKTKEYPDFSYIEKELRRPNVTLMRLWEEYKENNSNGMTYVHFTRLYNKWEKKHKISMKQRHLAGDKLFVDFCGGTVPIYASNQEILFNAKIFVGVMGASQFTVTYAVESEKKKDWLLCHVKAFEQMGAVPNFVVPDNLKSAVTRNTRDSVEVNRSYLALAEHYDCFILPARPLKPQDKSLAEIGVKIVQNQILAKYRNYKFYSLSELNQKLEDETKILNAKHSKNLNGSRIERFLSIDADAMKILPAEPYALDDWQYEVKVPKDYHICVGTNYYSVPFQYVGQHVDIQIGINTISIFHERTPIASYKKSEKTQDIISTTAHMPATHEYQQELDPDRLLAWGKKIGKSTHEVVRKNIKERKDVNNGFICVKYLKKWLIDHDDRELLEKACEYALKINSCTKQTMISLLKNKPFLNLANKEKTTKNKDKKSHENIRGSDYYKEVHKNDN